MSTLNSVKVSFGDDIRRFTMEGNSFVTLKEIIRSLYHVDSEFAVKYQDDEEDWINIQSDQELATAFLFCKGTLKITVDAKENWIPSQVLILPLECSNQSSNHPVRPIEEINQKEKPKKKYTEILPLTEFVHTFHIRNETQDIWPQTCKLVFKKKDKLSEQESIGFPRDIAPGEEFDISIPMKAPLEVGRYRSVWMMIGPDGKHIGKNLKVNICVQKAMEDLEIQMAKLAVMGFEDRDLNEKILKKGKGNFDRVVFKLMKHQNKKNYHKRKLEKKNHKKDHRLSNDP